MNQQRLREFMLTHHLDDKKLADLLGVTRMAVINWLGGKRTISLTVTRILNLFDRKPDLMREF